MPLTSNKLVKQLDLPAWEVVRPMPVAPTNGFSASCNADNGDFNEISGRYIYTMINDTQFWRYDSLSDTYLQLARSPFTLTTAISMRFAGAMGYYGRTISATSTTLTSGLPFAASPVGYRIKIVSGRGAGQTRIVASVSDPVVVEFGVVTTGSSTQIIDATKNWGLGAAGTTTNLNQWAGYVVRITNGTPNGMVRKILYNNTTTLTMADPNLYAVDSWAVPMSTTAGTSGMVATTANTSYSIESSTITVDTAWDVTPDDSSKFLIQSGVVILADTATVANGGVALAYYSVLEDTWYAKSVNNAVVATLATDMKLERLTENSQIWYTGKSTTTGTTTKLTDTTASWNVNQFAGRYCYMWSGTGRGQLGIITSNTATELTFSNTLSTAPNDTTYYDIIGYDAGTLTSTSGRIVFDTSKSWAVDRWKNYCIRILVGTGAGQYRQIISNGSTSLVTYEPWNVQPDNTSIYCIIGHPSDLYLTIGGNPETYLYRMDDTDILTHSRILDSGTNCIACAIPCDGTNTTTHEILEQKPISLTSLTGSSPITATTSQNHNLEVGQWVSIRGVTSAAADVYNITGKVQIATVPSSTTFTYTPFAVGSGTYQYSSNVALGVSALIDASKTHADRATGGSTTSVTFSRAQPSNINGWYAYGTNIAAGAQVASGAGTTTINFNLTGAGTPTDTITFTKWPLPVSLSTGGGGGAGVFTATTATTIPNYAKGWLVTGTGIGLGAILTGGEGTTTLNLSVPCTGAVSGTLVLSNPCNNMAQATGTYSSGSGTSITLTGNTPTYITGWYVSGTNIANGTTVTGGAGTATITLSTSTGGTPTGTITFLPPSTGIALYAGTTVAPVVAATGFLTVTNIHQLVAQNTSNATIQIPLAAITAPTAGISRYCLIRRDPIATAYTGHNLYLSGVATAGSATVLTDGNAFWATATGSGSAGGQTITLSAIGSPIHNGWYVSGTGIPLGARIVRGGGTTSITIDTRLTGAVSGTITCCAWNTSGATNSQIVGRRVRVLAGGGVNGNAAITAISPGTGALTVATATAAANTIYAIYPGLVPGAGSTLEWVSDSSVNIEKGRNFIRFFGGNTQIVTKTDVTTDQISMIYTMPFTELFGTGTMYAYDGYDRIYINSSPAGTSSTRILYYEVPTQRIHGAGQYPYIAGTGGVGNLMEIFKTKDGLKFLWVNRKAAVDCYRQLVFY